MIATICSLYVLLFMDAAFSGVCAASGRNALIEKRFYYLRSMWHGAVWGNVACIVGVVVLLIAFACSGDRPQTLAEMVVVGNRMAGVYWIYAAAVLLAFAVRAIPSVDVRATTSTVAFGPLTMIRPAVVLAGILWGLRSAPGIEVAIAAALIAAMMMPFRVFLNRRFVKMKAYSNSQQVLSKDLATAATTQ